MSALSDLLNDFHFIRPLWLLVIPLAFGVWWLWQKSIDPLRGWRAQMEAELVEALYNDAGSPVKSSHRWWLLGWVLALVALAGPTWRVEPNPFADDTAPLLVLLKVDASMESPPPEPSPLKRGQLKIADLAQGRQGLPMGLIAYAGSAHLVLPPTRDTQVVAEMASQLQADVMPVQGDRLELALRRAAQLIQESQAGGSILVIANSAPAEMPTIDALRQELAGIPIQFLSTANEDSDQLASIQSIASQLRATVYRMSIEPSDVEAILSATAKYRPSGIAGQATRWQEAGLWLLPVLLVMLAFAFRREELLSVGESR
ncbi:MAG: VWA domain-containing protein [bacterium]|nr:VWA domain-containing protein [bacterium]